jgi:adenine-specific DNA-methyltransferase
MENPAFYTVDDVAKNLQVTRQTVSKYINSEKLNAVKINKSYRIARSDFDRFISNNATVHEPVVSYLRKSKNCKLDYDEKSDEFEILNAVYDGSLKCKERNHDGESNMLINGDNYFVLRELLHSYYQKIDLIYIDPPFGTGRDFNSIDQDSAYSDTVVDHLFLEFLRKRLVLLRELLSENGSIYIHIDKKTGHYVRVIMDEVFGSQNFINDITRIKCNPKNFARNAYGNYTDMILFYSKNPRQNSWNELKATMNDEKRKILFPKKHPKYGQYTTNPIHAPGLTNDGDTGKPWKGIMPPKGRHWRYSRKVLSQLDEGGLIEWSSTGNPRKIVPASEHKGFKIQDMWEFKDRGLSYTDYPTQKNGALLQRIIANSSNKNSIVLDCFAGSGTTLIEAEKLNRKWIGIDSSPHSLKVIRKKMDEMGIDCNFYEFQD